MGYIETLRQQCFQSKGKPLDASNIQRLATYLNAVVYSASGTAYKSFRWWIHLRGARLFRRWRAGQAISSFFV